MSQVQIITRSSDLPDMECRDFFHSVELFKILEQTPGSYPYMVIVTDDTGRIESHLLAMINRRGSWLPPYLYSVGRIYGEGQYESDIHTEQMRLFELMVEAVTRKFKRKLCLYIEFSNISRKMFGYKVFRKFSYFPIRWMQIDNNLQSMPPIDRLTEKMRNRISNLQEAGVTTESVKSQEDLDAFYKILKSFYRFKFQRFVPKQKFFEELQKVGTHQLYITRYKQKVIGVCTVVYSQGDAYLWYLASKRKSFPLQHPHLMTVWHALEGSHEHGCGHLHFMNVGLPFRKNPQREFILRFQGKPASTYRWFRCSLRGMNRLLNWINRE